jgi:non-heme chloroperoxidase
MFNDFIIKHFFMPYIKTSKSSLSNPVNLYYEDTKVGKPVIFIHGWPLNSNMWEYQVNELSLQGIRCITYDRRGFGKSDRPLNGYDYDSLAADLKTIIDELSLESVTLVGFSMGGGEVARYIGRYGTNNIEKVVLVGSVTPYMLKQDDNPDGMPMEDFETFARKLRDDRPAFISEFGKSFYGIGFLSQPVSDAFLDWNQTLAMQASPFATLACLQSFSTTDFRNDLSKFDIPTLIIHGDNDKTVPINISGHKTAALIPHAEFKIYVGEPHGLFYTQKDSLNGDLLDFIVGGKSNRAHVLESEISESLTDPLRFPNSSLL